ncbi:hypothetical protein Golax_022630, partial [Gossypium laxum]|nr:hypothetical protein [Gossypium laxum]
MRLSEFGQKRRSRRQWNEEVRQLFYSNYGDFSYLLDMKKNICFTSVCGNLSRQSLLESCKSTDFSKEVDEHNLDEALGHVDEAVTDLFDRLDKGVTPVPAILAETFRSLNACQKAGEGRFIGCAQLLLAWLYSHFWKVDKVSYQVFSENYSQLKEVVATLRRDDIFMEKWMAILQNLQEEKIEWRAPWLLLDEILYRCGDFDWVPLLGIWGAVGYAPLLVLRQYRSRQFIPTTQGLAECEFSYGEDGYKKKIRKMTNAWKQTRRMKRLVEGPMTTPEYIEWQ